MSALICGIKGGDRIHRQNIGAPKAENLPGNYNVVNIRWILKQTVPYLLVWILYYAWIGSFTTWWTASPLSEGVFNTPLRELMHTLNLISSAIFIFIIRKEWFVTASRIGAAVIVFGMTLFHLLPNSGIQTAAILVTSVAVGCVNVSILMPFIFLLNNTGKLYAAVGSNVLIQLISLILELNRLGRVWASLEIALSILLLAASLAAILFFRKRDIAMLNPAEAPPVMRRRVHMAIVFSCAVAALCKGVGKGILNVTVAEADVPVMVWYFIGGLVGCGLFLLIYAVSQKAFIWVGNLIFAGVSVGLFLNAFAPEAAGFALAFAILLGAGNTMGMINIYYILGVIGKKYNSMRYVRLSILLIGICGGVPGILLGNTISNISTHELTVTASIVSALFMISFMIISPIITQPQYEVDWAKDSLYPEIDNDQTHMFKKYALSKRETEVCKLLLQGYTMRQIAGMLSLAYPTVNTYCTSLYRKLNITSRTELIRTFKDYQ